MVVVMGSHYWLIVFTVWMLIRIYLLNKRYLVLITIVLGCGMALYAGKLQRQINQRTLTTAKVVHHRPVIIMGDQSTINGNRWTFVGRDMVTNQFVSGMAFLNSRQQVKYLKNSVTNVQVTVDGQLQPLMPPTNTNQRDFRSRYYHQGICNQLMVKRVDHISRTSPSPLDIHYYRVLAGSYFNDLPSPLSTYCSQLILGDSGAVADRDFRQSIRRLGIIHLFCISGLHVSALVAGIVLLLTYCRVSRETSEWLIICVLPVYAVFGGQSVGLIRAVLMTEASLLGRKFYPLSALDTWALSLLGGLMINPWLLLDLGGQLSYLLSLGLQVLPPKWGPFRQSVTLNLLSFPSIISFIYEFHWLTFLASFVMIPIFTYCMFPAVILSALTYRYLPGIANLTNTLLLCIQRVLVTVSTCPGMIAFGKPPLIISCGLFFMTCLAIDHRWNFNYCFLVLAYIGAFCIIHFQPVGEVTFVDIGQGDSIIIRTPFNRHITLIDTGGKVHFAQPAWARTVDSSNMAERTSINYLKSRGIKRIDTIFLSHHDADHIGYLPSFVQTFNVHEIVVPSGMENQAVVRRLIAGVPNPPVIKPMIANQSFSSGLMCLHPFKTGQGNNEDSLVLWGKVGMLRFIFSGDLDQQGELAVVHRYPQLRADVVKLGHHGSKTSSNGDYLATLHPQIGIISAGRHNHYGHPNQETISTLHRLRIKNISTQQYGMISYHYFGSHYWWTTTLKGDELLWTLKPSRNN